MPRSTPPQERVIFLHIPKTAGRTLTFLMQRHYGSLGTATVGEVDPFAAVVHPDSRWQRVVGLSNDEMAQVGLIKGHMRFGLHEHLSGPYRYATLIREPVARVRSVFNHLTSGRYGAGRTEDDGETTKPDFPVAEQVRRECPDPMALVRSGLCLEVDNGQTRRLSGIDPPYGECTAEMLAVAKHNLRTHFSVVGVTDRFRETVVLMRRQLHWSSVLYQPMNGMPRVGDQGNAEAIATHNRYDLELYAFAQALMDEQMAAAGADFPLEVEGLRLANSRLDGVSSMYPKEDVPLTFFEEQVRLASARWMSADGDPRLSGWEYLHWRSAEQMERARRQSGRTAVTGLSAAARIEARLKDLDSKYRTLRERYEALKQKRDKAQGTA